MMTNILFRHVVRTSKNDFNLSRKFKIKNYIKIISTTSNTLLAYGTMLFGQNTRKKLHFIKISPLSGI